MGSKPQTQRAGGLASCHHYCMVLDIDTTLFCCTLQSSTCGSWSGSAFDCWAECDLIPIQYASVLS